MVPKIQQIVVEGIAYNLRPVTEDDAEFIVGLRTGDAERTRFLGSVDANVQRQRAWLHAFHERHDETYWVIERKFPARHSEGLVSIYRMNREKKDAEWGRWIIAEGSLAAVESALLVYRAAFDLMGLDSIYCITADENSSVLSFHDQCGLVREAVLPGRLKLPSGRADGIQHRCHRAQWPAIRAKLEQQAAMTARILLRKKAP